MALQNLEPVSLAGSSVAREWVVWGMNEATRTALAKNLRAARQAAGLSQRDLARITGIAQPDISDIERADPRVNPTLDKLNALANALGTTAADLLSLR